MRDPGLNTWIHTYQSLKWVESSSLKHDIKAWFVWFVCNMLVKIDCHVSRGRITVANKSISVGLVNMNWNICTWVSHLINLNLWVESGLYNIFRLHLTTFTFTKDGFFHCFESVMHRLTTNKLISVSRASLICENKLVVSKFKV